MFSSKQSQRTRGTNKWLYTLRSAEKLEKTIVIVELKILSQKQQKKMVLIQSKAIIMKYEQPLYFVPRSPNRLGNSLRAALAAKLTPHTMIIGLEVLSISPMDS